MTNTNKTLSSPARLIIDRDCVTMVLADAEHTPARSRAAIDEIARRVEALFYARGIPVEVERDYHTTGRRDDASEYGAELEAVLVGQVDEIRAAVLEG